MRRWRLPTPASTARRNRQTALHRRTRQPALQPRSDTLKEGIGEDAGNRERIAKLLRFASTKGDGGKQTVSLDDYIGRMAGGQDTIWFITAESHAAAAGSPQLEAFKAKDIEVPLMSDRNDEWMLGYLHEYDV